MNLCRHEFRGPLIAVLAIACFTNSTRADPPSSRWNVGDIWNFDVQPVGKQPYRMHVMVVAVKSEKGAACWQLNCQPNDHAPSYLKRYRLFVDKKTGSPMRALRLPEKQEIAVETAGSASFLTPLPEGMPLELFNPADLPTGKADIAGTTRRVEVRKEVKTDHFVVELVMFDNDVEQWTIRQQWVTGEIWWHTYERTVKGEKTLKARRLFAPEIKSQPGAGNGQDPATLAARFPLRMVPELRRKVPVVGSDIQLANLLEHLRTVTGLKMTLADNLTYHEPKFSELQGGRDATAWMVMDLIVRMDLDDGRWVKTDDGYMLTGTSKALKIPPRQFPWGWVGGGAGLLLLASTGYGIFRWRRKRSAASPPAHVGKAAPKKATAHGPPGGKHAKPS